MLTDKKEVLDSTRKALRILREEGHDTVIATGRNAMMSQEVFDTLDFHQYIVCNGAEAFVNHESIYKNPLNEEALARLLEIADYNQHSVVYETAHELIRRSSEIGDRVKEGMKFVGQDVPTYDESKTFHLDRSLIQLLLFIDSKEKEELYLNQNLNEFRFVRWHENAVDVLPANGSKAETISYLAKHKGFDKEDVITFGDGNNDIEMTQNAGIGVAMGNAVPKVKEVADLVTDTNEQDGIYKALKELDLI